MKLGALVAILAVALTGFVVSEADAAKLGGGRSLGAQRPSVAPRAATPPASTPSGAASQPVMPAQPGATLPAKPLTPQAAPSGASRWLGPIAGLAAGIGLAALLSHFGLPEGLGTFLLLALLAVGVIFVVRMLFARRSQGERPLSYAAGRPAAAPPPFEMRRMRHAFVCAGAKSWCLCREREPFACRRISSAVSPAVPLCRSACAR